MWEGNGKEILKFFEWEANGKELISFFQRKKEKGRKKLGKVSEICQNGPKIGKHSKFCIILHFSCVVHSGGPFLPPLSVESLLFTVQSHL